jgi:UDP-4-amino-4,6-dideoxy-N-acetyl-beta-L-altrosamine N-acetyltransferase
MILTWRNHPNVSQFMLTQHKITNEEHLKWFEDSQHDDSTRRVIIEDVNGPMGFVQFNSRAGLDAVKWGFYVRPDSPSGSGRKLGYTALNYGFGRCGYTRIYGESLVTNERSMRLHLSLGFTSVPKVEAGAESSLICFALSSNDWRPARFLEENKNASD